MNLNDTKKAVSQRNIFPLRNCFSSNLVVDRRVVTIDIRQK